MSHVIDPATTAWTATDLVNHFGPIPLTRVRLHPAPGTATEADVVRIHDHEGRLYELVDRTLVEKAVGTYESYLAAQIVRILGTYAHANDLGIVLGADGMLRLAPGLVRIPDVSFISWARLPNRRIPRQAIADIAPDLAVEVISPGNTREEMDRKLGEYFAAGVKLVWYIDPQTREARVFTSVEDERVISVGQSLDGGQVLPGFSLSLAELFAEGVK